MLVLLDSVADFKRLMSLDIIETFSLIECNAIQYHLRAAIYQLKLYVLKILAHKLARTKVIHIFCREYGLLISRTKGVEPAQVAHKLRSNLIKIKFTIEIN